MRRILAIIAVAVFALASLPLPAHAVDSSQRHIILGASITRLAGSELKSQIPYIVVDAHDGRSWEIPATDGSGLTLWQSYLNEKPLLRPGHGDWLIIEIGYGTVPVATNQQYIEAVLADLDPSIQIALVDEHVCYGACSQTQLDWDSSTNLMLRSLDPHGHRIVHVNWDQWVTDWTTNELAAGEITPAQALLSQPLTYDGRHPTGSAAHPGKGAWRYAAGVAAAVS